MKGLPLAYAKDMQEDKEPVFDADRRGLSLSLAAMARHDAGPSFPTRPACAPWPASGFATATDLADWLVRQLGLPFRDAHHVTGRIVAAAEARGTALEELPLAAMQDIEPRITADVFAVLGVNASIASRTSIGGTAPANVRAQATAWLARLDGEPA